MSRVRSNEEVADVKEGRCKKEREGMSELYIPMILSLVHLVNQRNDLLTMAELVNRESGSLRKK